MSADPRKKLEEEIQTLERELREELPKALKTRCRPRRPERKRRLSAARERQDFVRVRLGQLKQRLADLSLVNFDKIPAGPYLAGIHGRAAGCGQETKRSLIGWSPAKTPT